MHCFWCSISITGKIRWGTVAGERVPFHTPTLIYDCANEYYRSQLKKGEHQANDTYAILRPCPSND